MVNEDDGKPIKKPIPLPRKSLLKGKKAPECKKESVETSPVKPERKNFIRDDWRSASESFVFEKKKLMKNEVDKFERSVKNIISKRRSSQLKSSNKVGNSELNKCESLPDNSVFFNISFNSPLSDDGRDSQSQSSSYLDDSYYGSQLSLPPPYPPPDLPDESIYDQMRCFDISDQGSVQSNNSDSALYGCISSCNSSNTYTLEPSQNDSINIGNSYLGSIDNESGDHRYEFVCDNPSSAEETSHEESILNDKDWNNENGKNDVSHIKYIIHLFDPLQSNEMGCSSKIPQVINALAFEGLNSASGINLDSECVTTSEFPKKLTSFPTNFNSVSLSKDDTYGKIKKCSKTNNEDVKVSGEYGRLLPPPIPPKNLNRALPISNEVTEDKKESQEPDQQLVNISSEEKVKASDIIQWSTLKRVARKVADNIEHRSSYLGLVSKKSGKVSTEESSPPPFNKTKSSLSASDILSLPMSFPKHSGIMFRPGGVQRWGVLSQRKLTLFANKDSPDVKETVPMDGVLSVQSTQNKINTETVGVHCFEISIASRNQLLLFGVPSVSERHIWMRKLLESIGPSFPTKLSMDYTKAGWCFAKESVSHSWSKSCVLLHHRTVYLSSDHGSLITADLRKVRKITLQTEGFPCEDVTEKGPLMLVDLQGKTLYLQMDYERETKAWECALTTAALKNGPTLCEQQLTKDDVPAIVDKCLNFVHTHGIFSEGIYRRNGSNRTVSQLLAAFRCNAWSVNLSKDECSEFDVSSVLKRYFRDLPEPLLIPEIQGELGKALDTTDIKEKVELFKTALKQLPNINYLTARKLLGHLYFISKQKEKNLMGAENLASIWGPTILQAQEQVSLDSNCFKTETLIVNDLICYYPEIFDVKQSEVDREMKILQMLEVYSANNTSLRKKPSGELKIWVYLDSPKNVDDCVNVSVHPHKTAEEVCKELTFKTTNPIHSLSLEEVICNGHLIRPLHHSEKVLDTVLRWSYWDELDRKENCLVLTKNDLFQQVVQYSSYPVIFSDELKFADQKSKAFKTCQVDFSHAKLIIYKDKMCSQKLGEWKVEDIVWYLGHEPKRVPNMKWSITFIEKRTIGPRTKEKPYFGNTLCGTSEEQKLKLVTAMLMAQYAKAILPTHNFLE